MDQRRLHKLLRELHEELLGAESVDPKARDLLRHLADDIRLLVASGPDTIEAGRYHGLRGRLADTMTGFEVTHPRLSQAMERVIDVLALYNL